MKTFQFRARIEHRQAVTSFGIGTDLICSRRGETHTSSLNTLSTPNKIIPWDKKRSDTCVVPGSLLKQRGSLERQLAYLQRLAASSRLICLIEHRRICIVLQDPNKHRFCQQGGKNLAKK